MGWAARHPVVITIFQPKANHPVPLNFALAVGQAAHPVRSQHTHTAVLWQAVRCAWSHKCVQPRAPSRAADYWLFKNIQDGTRPSLVEEPALSSQQPTLSPATYSGALAHLHGVLGQTTVYNHVLPRAPLTVGSSRTDKTERDQVSLKSQSRGAAPRWQLRRRARGHVFEQA